MFWKRREKTEKKPAPKTVDGGPAGAFTARCLNGCTRIGCASRYEAEVFCRRMGRCPQCGGELAVYGAKEQIAEL